jgi:hypothetical protein
LYISEHITFQISDTNFVVTIVLGDESVKLLLWYINTFSGSSEDIWFPVSEVSEYDSSPSTIVTTKFVSEI